MAYMGEPGARQKMTDSELLSLLNAKRDTAQNTEERELSEVRARILSKYRGDGYRDDETKRRQGYSTFITREMMEILENAKPTLMKVFTAAKKVVSFEPVDADDEMLAEHETDVVNYKILKANDGNGWMAIYTFIFDALLYPTAYAKAYIDDREITRTHTRTDLMPATLSELLDDDAIEITEQDSRRETVMLPMRDEQTGQEFEAPQEIELFDITYRETRTERKLHIIGVPPEEVLVDNDLTTLNLDEADYVCHRRRLSYTDLVQMGFDESKLKMAERDEGALWQTERTNRLHREDELPDTQGTDTASMQMYTVYESYVKVDFEGTGVAQMRRVVYIGSQIFENDEVDYQPFVAMSTVPMTHKLNGVSLAELVETSQDLMTTLSRELLDNIYAANTKKTYISRQALIPGEHSMNSLLNRRAKFVIVEGDPNMATAEEPHVSVIGDVLATLQDARMAAAIRSGVSPQSSVDQNTLQQANTGAFLTALDKSSERVEHYARTFAETGLKTLFLKVHRLCRMYPDIVTALKLRGEWVQPRADKWNERTDVTVNVSFGFSNKTQMLELFMQLLGIQKEALSAGLATPKNIYNTLDSLIEYAELGDVRKFFTDPESPEGQQVQQQNAQKQQQDPNLIAAQALMMEQQNKQAQIQQDGQVDMAKIQLEDRKTQLKEAEMQVKTGKLAIDSEKAKMDAEKARLEAELKQLEAQIKIAEMQLQKDKQDAEIDNIDMDTSLKEAQVEKTLAEADKTDAETDKTDAEVDETDAKTVKTLEEADNVGKDTQPSGE